MADRFYRTKEDMAVVDGRVEEIDRLRAENERLRTSLRNVCKLINVSGYVDAEELAALNEAKAILTETKG